jgi:murein tripeptide amidase MpaA
MSLHISSTFCGGNIEVVSASDPTNIRLNIPKDNQSDFYQWFYFRVVGKAGQDLRMTIENAGGSAYPKGWENYNAVASYNLHAWNRIPTTYKDGELVMETTLELDAIYIAYFAPYTMERHAQLVTGAQLSERASLSVLGSTLDGRDIDMITIGEAGEGKRPMWLIARQHPGESMAEWWMEGFLERALNPNDAAMQTLLKQAVLYVVPNMNPDGSARGHLRTNAAGVNLNREWQSPTMEKSPEVYLTLQKMHETGVDFMIDVHGDEALPYNFIAGSEGIPNYTDHLQNLLDTFKADYVTASRGEFQTKYGYPVNSKGNANLTICGNAIGHAFDCLAMTLEMPFKDNADKPNAKFGWSPERCKQLGADVIDVLAKVVPNLREA